MELYYFKNIFAPYLIIRSTCVPIITIQYAVERIT